VGISPILTVKPRFDQPLRREKAWHPERMSVALTNASMLLTLTTTYQPATDLGYLLRKNPGRLQSFELNFGTASVFYPEATSERCTCALLVEVDPVALVRRRRGPSGEGGVLDQYVNDRPYAAS